MEYFDSNTKTFHSEISDMDELKNRIALLEQCRKDDAEMENKIKPIEDARPSVSSMWLEGSRRLALA